MRNLIYAGLMIVAAGFQAYGSIQGPEVELINNRLSVRADAVPLSRLLTMLDRSTGMVSKVAPELANRNVSVEFTGLSLNDGIRKIFEGQRLDYVYIGGKGIFVTSASLTGPIQEQPIYSSQQPIIAGEPSFTQAPFPNQNQNPFPTQNDAFVGGQVAVPQPGAQQQQPAMIQTPFGPIPNPRANQGAQQPGANNGPIPGQQNGLPVPGQTNPLGGPSVFGAPSALSPTPLGDNNNPLGNPVGPGSNPLNPGTFPGIVPARP
jgi:hypothetical protein